MQDSLVCVILTLLAEGAYIEQTTSTPIAYKIVHHGQSAALPGSIVQRLQVSHKVHETELPNGKRRLYLRKKLTCQKPSDHGRGQGQPRDRDTCRCASPDSLIRTQSDMPLMP